MDTKKIDPSRIDKIIKVQDIHNNDVFYKLGEDGVVDIFMRTTEGYDNRVSILFDDTTVLDMPLASVRLVYIPFTVDTKLF